MLKAVARINEIVGVRRQVLQDVLGITIRNVEAIAGLNPREELVTV